MPWVGDKFIYTVKLLKAIAEQYDQIYEGFSFKGHTIMNPLSIIEYKSDFDMALKGIGKGSWTGHIDGLTFNDFKYYGRLQQIVIGDIYGISDYELMGLGFWNVSQMRGMAYYRMQCLLNGVDIDVDGKPCGLNNDNDDLRSFENASV